MKEYIISIVCVSIIGSLVSMLVPDGEGGGLGKHTRLVFGLCLIIVCMYPIKNAILFLDELDIKAEVGDAAPDSDELESIFDSSYSTAEAESLRQGIKTLLCDRFDIDMSECKVTLSLGESGEGMGRQEIERIFITLYGSAIWKNTGEIDEYFSSIFKCEVITAIG